MRFFSKLFVLLFVMLTLSCSKDEPDASGLDEEKLVIQKFLDSMTIDAEVSPSGLYYYPVTLNPAGTPAAGRVVSLYYTLTVLGGDTIQKYDSIRGEAFLVKQGVNAIYPVGFDEALSYMKEGEKWGFIMPSNLAYGNLSFSSLIPENATIEAKIEVLDVRNEEEVLDDQAVEIENYIVDNNLRDTVANPLNPPKKLTQGLGMAYKRIRAGGTTVKPATADTVQVTYEIKNLQGEQLAIRGAANAFEFVIDQGEVFTGLNIGVKQMSQGERALLIVPSAVGYSYSAAVVPDFNDFKSILVEEKIIPTYAAKIRPYEIILVDLELINVE